MLLKKQKQLDYVAYLELLHGESQGWITKAQIKDNYIQKHFKINELVKQNILCEKDLYISMNTFYKPQRRIENLKELNALYIDLDIYNTKFSKEQILMDLEKNYYGSKIPIPSLVVDSGRGLYLIWLINFAPYKALPLWKAIEEYLYKNLKEFGADRKALDCTRVLRAIGTINSKSNTEVKILDFYNYRYDLREIQKEFLPELVPKKGQKGGKKKVYYVHRERSLYHSRLLDLAKLCNIRNYNLRGNRELILFLYRYYSCYFEEDTEKALIDTLELNSLFKEPLRERDVIIATRSAEKTFKNKEKDYKYKNATLIDLLDITKEEQEQLKIIIDSRTKLDRKNESRKEKRRNADGFTKREQQKKDTYKSIQFLKSQGLTQKEITQQLKISLRTVKNHWK